MWRHRNAGIDCVNYTVFCHPEEMGGFRLFTPCHCGQMIENAITFYISHKQFTTQRVKISQLIHFDDYYTGKRKIYITVDINTTKNE